MGSTRSVSIATSRPYLRERDYERERESVCVGERESMCVCVRARERQSVCVRERECVDTTRQALLSSIFRIRCSVQGAGFRVQGEGFRVGGKGAGCRVQGAGFRVDTLARASERRAQAA